VRFQNCRSLWRDHEYLLNGSMVFDDMAPALFQHGDAVRSATLSSVAATTRYSTHGKLAADDQVRLQACRTALGSQAFDLAWNTGRTLPLLHWLF
jgi:hypothetical protein